MISFPEFDLARIKFPAFYKEQILEIEDSNSISELKNIAKSKVYEIQRINTDKDKENEKQFYIVLILIGINSFLYFTKKGLYTHNS
jgi:hypothetical protein